MEGEDARRQAAEALARLRDNAVCGTCRADYTVMIDALQRDGEFEELMREYVAIGRRHQEAGALASRADGITGARDEAAKMLSRLKGERKKPSTPGFVRAIRNDMVSAIPRPFGLLNRSRRRS